MTCIKEVVYAEARGESERGKTAVAYVLLNRARESGRSVCLLSHENGQFKRRTPARDFRIDVTSPDPTNGATAFRTRDMPRWLGLMKHIRIGGQTFYGK